MSKHFYVEEYPHRAAGMAVLTNRIDPQNGTIYSSRLINVFTVWYKKQFRVLELILLFLITVKERPFMQLSHLNEIKT